MVPGCPACQYVITTCLIFLSHRIISAIPNTMNTQYTQGFTLVELIATLAVTAVVLTLGIPSFRDIILSNTITAKANGFIADLTLTRSESIKRGSQVTMCQSTNQSSCTETGEWEKGWIIFSDADEDGVVGDGPVIKSVSAFSGTLTVRGNSTVENSISYKSSGKSSEAGSFIFCDERIHNFSEDKSKARVVIVSTTGRIRTVKGDDGTVTFTSCTP